MAKQQAPTHYCDSYGFDAAWRARCLRLLDLGAAEAVLGERLREEVIRPHAEAIVTAFYAKLDADAQAVAILDGVDRAHLRATQIDYLHNFGRDYLEQAYFEERLRIGLVHAWVGVPLSLYICSHQVMQGQIMKQLVHCVGDEYKRRCLCLFVNKISALDMALASEIYHIAQVRHLESSVDRLRHERSQLRIEADTDALTGLDNRASLLPRLADELSAAQRSHRPLCIIMADLDHFKDINDEHGHQVGDQVLRDTAARLRAGVRDFDRVGRYGGEEFIAVLLDAGLDTAEQVAERVRRRVGDHPFNIVGQSLAVTLSQGLAQARPDDSVETLIERADQALYAAKQAGRNCVRTDAAD